jgi:alanine-synthesizing transaminase
MIFSQRTEWHREPNRLSELLESRRKSGKPVYDLTLSNPTDCGIAYPGEEILTSLSNSQALRYQPDPHGLLSARETIRRYYERRSCTVDPSGIFLTASTSEAYSILFKLLCDPGGEILVPQPSYPLFDHLAQLNDVRLTPYRLTYDNAWDVDIDSVREGITPSTKALIIINPHNPTGMFLHDSTYRSLAEIATEHPIALIVDEVFIDYPLDPGERVVSTAGEERVLTFTLNGISKMAGLPQMKLGWIVVSGPRGASDEASQRLEILSDTYLSVNTPVQVALSEMLKAGESVRANILARIRDNFACLRKALPSQSPVSVLNSEGGWSAIIRVPTIRSDEEWALELLQKEGLYVHPGYFYDFETEGHLVVSLLTPRETFHRGVRDVIEFVTH